MAIKIFFCYAHEDEALLNKLKAHLKPFQLEGLIELWYDRDISAGTEWEREISKHLNTADIILLLISPDFMASEYCYSIEMKRAVERHECEEARVIPVILRPVYWQIEKLGGLQALPKDGKPVIGSHLNNIDEAFLDIAKGIRRVVTSVRPHTAVPLLENRLSTPQKQFLKVFLSQAGEQAVEKKFSYIRQGKIRYLRWNHVKIDLNLSDGDLIELAHWGYLRIYASSRSIFFTKQALEAVYDSLE